MSYSQGSGNVKSLGVCFQTGRRDVGQVETVALEPVWRSVGRPSRELPPAIASRCGKMPSVVESHTALSLSSMSSTPTQKEGRPLDPRSLTDQRSATRIQMPIPNDTRAPQTIIGLVGIALAIWLVTKNHRMKQPIAITMPPISEAMGAGSAGHRHEHP